MNKNTLVFDFDGTIADTFLYFVNISNRLAKEFNYNLIHDDDIEDIRHKTSKEIVGHLNVPIMKIPAIFRKGKSEFFKDVEKLKLIEDLKEVLIKIKDLGYSMGILSSNSSKNIETFFDNHGINIFNFIHSSPKVWSKNTCLKRLIKDRKMDIKKILYIGDETRDIDAAKKTGVKVAAVTWGYNSAEVLKKHNPDYLIHSPEELLGVCEGF